MDGSIQTQEDLIAAVKYIATATSRLAHKVVGRTFPIKSLAVFSHSQEEFDLLLKIQVNMGRAHSYDNGPRVELFIPIETGDNHVTHLCIRKPTSEYPQIGCSDFETDYNEFKKEYLAKYPDKLFLIERRGYEMIERIEMRDEEFNVVAYVVSGLVRTF